MKSSFTLKKSNNISPQFPFHSFYRSAWHRLQKNISLLWLTGFPNHTVFFESQLVINII